MQTFPPSTSSSRRSSIIQPINNNASQYSFAETAVQSPNASCATFVPTHSSSTLAVNGVLPSKASSLKYSESWSPQDERKVNFGPVDQQLHINTSDLPSKERPGLTSYPSDVSGTPSEEWKRTKGFWRSFVAMCLPLLLSALEGSVTNTALPTISADLNL